MKEKNKYSYERERSVTIGFRVSPEESEHIDELVALSGLNKQDYILHRLKNENMQLIMNPRIYLQMVTKLNTAIGELKRIENGCEVKPDLLNKIYYLGSVIADSRVADTSG